MLKKKITILLGLALGLFLIKLTNSVYSYTTDSVEFIVDLEIYNSDEKSAEFFWSLDNSDFSSERRIVIPANQGPQTISFPAKVKKIRLDPAFNSAQIVLKKMEVVNRDRKIIYNWMDGTEFTKNWIANEMVGSIIQSDNEIKLTSIGADPILQNRRIQANLQGYRTQNLKFVVVELIIFIIVVSSYIFTFRLSLLEYSFFSMLNQRLRQLRAQLSKELILALSLTLIVWTSLILLWPYLRLPYSNPLDIAGVAQIHEINPKTNVFRFMTFVFAPTIFFILIQLLRRNPIFNAPSESEKKNDSKKSNAFAFIICTAGVLIFFLIGTLEDYPKLFRIGLDFFHHGDYLAPSLKYRSTGQIWSGSFLTRGGIFDLIPPTLSWTLFNRFNLGSFLLTLKGLNAATYFFYGLFFLTIPFVLRKKKSAIDLILLTTIFLAVIVFQNFQNLYPFDFRMIVCFLELTCLFGAILFNNRVAFFMSGLFAPLIPSSEWTILYLCIAIFVMSSQAFWTRPRLHAVFTSLGAFAFGLTFGCFIFVSVFSVNESISYLHQIRQTMTHWPFIYFLEYPKPNLFYFQPSTWYLILFSAAVLEFFLDLKLRKSDQFILKINFLILIFALGGFMTALGRADSSHIAVGAALSHILFAFVIWKYLHRRSLWIKTGVLISSLFYITQNFYMNGVNIDWQSIEKTPEIVEKYINLGDEQFLEPQDVDMVRFAKNKFSAEKCIFVFSNHPAMYYLLNKPSCGRFYFAAHASGIDFESELLDDLKNVNWIIESESDSQLIDRIENRLRLRKVAKMIDSDFSMSQKVGRWMIFRRISNSEKKGNGI